jgi:hypothetical protein
VEDAAKAKQQPQTARGDYAMPHEPRPPPDLLMESGDIRTPNLSRATMRVGKEDSEWRRRVDQRRAWRAARTRQVPPEPLRARLALTPEHVFDWAPSAFLTSTTPPAASPGRYCHFDRKMTAKKARLLCKSLRNDSQ